MFDPVFYAYCDCHVLFTTFELVLCFFNPQVLKKTVEMIEGELDIFNKRAEPH